MIILGTNSIKDTGFDVANSARFQNAQLLRTNSGSTSTNIDKYTISVWLKRSKLGVDSNIIADTDGSNNYYQIYFKSDDTIRWQEYLSGSQSGALITNRKFRDVGAWYNLIFRYDSSLGTAGDRMRMYVNGVEETSFSTDVNPSQNANGHFGEASSQKCIADNNADGREYFGYMCEFMGVDGQSLAPDQFGEFDSDSGIWKPIDISGITQGVHGFYLKFEDSSDLGVATLGSNWTGAGLAATDQSTDTCTNNFCVMNPLDNFYAGNTFSEGNLKIVGKSDQNAYNTSTFGISNGKWYYEQKITSTSSNGESIGITDHTATAIDDYLGDGAYEYGYYSSNGKVYNNGGNTAYGATFDTGDIMGIYIDLDNNKLYFAKNGTVQNSGTGISITAPASTSTGFYFVSVSDNGNTGTYELNFGSPSFAISSGNTDDNGYGNFEYSPNITGDSVAKKFYALNTKNLAEYG